MLTVSEQDVDFMLEKWVPALRSGKYQQTSEVLRADETHFCCLGVYCDIYPEGKWIDRVVTTMENVYVDDEDNEIEEEVERTVYEYNSPEETQLTDALGSEFGGEHGFVLEGMSLLVPTTFELPEGFSPYQFDLDEGRKYYFDSPETSYDDYAAYNLANANDRGASFEQIADAIELICLAWKGYYAELEGADASIS